jgi:hypothetical protein
MIHANVRIGFPRPSLQGLALSIGTEGGRAADMGLHEAVRGQFERFDIRASIANNGASLRA